MAATTVDSADRRFGPAYWVFTTLMVANVVAKILIPETRIAAVVSYAFIGSATLWFGLRIRAGYRRRRPHWTRESWLRFTKLAAMPAAATIFVLAMSTETGVSLMGPAKSLTRSLWAAGLLVLLLFGAIGLAAITEWLMQGDPSAQFTRRSWLPRRGSALPSK